jgi:iron complex transport system substrate-binding protein
VNDLRIASFLPAATEMVCALGLVDNLVGVSHECNYPPQVKGKPVVVNCAMDLASLDLKQVDEAVSRRVGEGQSVYAVDEEKLKSLSPTLIVTQDLCQVCAPSGNEASRALMSLRPKPEILWQTPHSFEDMLATFLELGEKTGTKPVAEKLIVQMRERISRIVSRTRDLSPVKAFFMEWVDPVYCGGHWVPEMLRWAGAADPISKPGVDSVRIQWDDVLAYDPDVLVIAPCGFGSRQALEQAQLLKSRSGWAGLSAVKNGKVFAVDANSYFARPGPRLVEGVELLAHLFHPNAFSWNGPVDAFSPVL